MKKTSDPAIKCRYTELRRLRDLRENPRNPNKHSPQQLELIARVIRAAGWRSPIVVSARSGLIVKGHGRYQAAQLAGWARVPVEVQAYRNAAEELADMLADNHLAELSALDPAKSRELLAELKGSDLQLTGYTEADLEKIFAKPELVKIKLAAPPKLAWALIGVPLTQFAKVQGLLDQLPAGATVHTTANDGR